MRQLIIETGGRKTSQTTVLAEGQLQEVPPAHTSCESRDEIHLDWEGQVKCADNISVGGFVAGNIVVKVRFNAGRRLVQGIADLFDLLGFHQP
jgi:hypothetical protein